MKRSEQRILTTHVGSLVRPKGLTELRAAASKSPDADRAYTRALTDAITDIVLAQAAHGVDIVSDGEFGKNGWANYVLDRMSGFVHREDRLHEPNWLGRDFERFRDHYVATIPPCATGFPTDVCTGQIVYTGGKELRRALDAFRTALDGAGIDEGFFTAVAPASTAYDGVNEHYLSEREYIFAIAGALAHEYRAIVEAGFILQVDDAVLANMYDTLIAAGGEEAYAEWAQLRIDALNYALRGIPEDRVRYHVCFGSWHGPHLCDAPLEAIAPFMLRVNAQAYSIEAANVRHEHEWRVWERITLPPGKILMPGLITHHTDSVEHPRLIADRIVRYADIVGRENVIASTDCGFSQVDFLQRCDPQVIWAKMEALAEGAALASRELWDRQRSG